eukprot:TRINITY_DN16621_c0_g1_i1.p2 TRINITY_DN16621_c0_g1~~TRINITY_DN16621_c0_g1_i1.p2  ORF type:complete len:263 (-),score=11.55 TRINITY_DN16621_c0_g1_i1:513-1301(-)
MAAEDKTSELASFLELVSFLAFESPSAPFASASHGRVTPHSDDSRAAGGLAGRPPSDQDLHGVPVDRVERGAHPADAFPHDRDWWSEDGLDGSGYWRCAAGYEHYHNPAARPLAPPSAAQSNPVTCHAFESLASLLSAVGTQRKPWHSQNNEQHVVGQHPSTASPGSAAKAGGECRMSCHAQDEQKEQYYPGTSRPPHAEAAQSLCSAGHASGACRPCAFFWKPEGCKRGELCVRCHLCPETAFRKYRRTKKTLKEDWRRPA